MTSIYSRAGEGVTYKVNNNAATSYSSGEGITTHISADNLYKAIERAHNTIDNISKFDVDIFAILGLRNLSAFMGEVYAASLIAITDQRYRKNPHQDGYPDLLLMDRKGKALWNTLDRRNQLRDKAPFSPFQNGGIEIKATCGTVPNDANCRRKGLPGKPIIGEQRIGVMTSYDWKAHHRNTNNLVGVLWDFIGGLPRIAAVFFCPTLTVQDWGKIIQPKDGGGNTTSVSIMTRPGVKKMYQHWVAVRNDDERYAQFLNKKNGGDLIP
jgi:hypothetical protein